MSCSNDQLSAGNLLCAAMRCGFPTLSTPTSFSFKGIDTKDERSVASLFVIVRAFAKDFPAFLLKTEMKNRKKSDRNGTVNRKKGQRSKNCKKRNGLERKGTNRREQKKTKRKQGNNRKKRKKTAKKGFRRPLFAKSRLCSDQCSVWLVRSVPIKVFMSNHEYLSCPGPL